MTLPAGRPRPRMVPAPLLVAFFVAAVLQLALIETGARARHGADFGKLYYGLAAGDLYGRTVASEEVTFRGRTFVFANLNPPHVALLVLPLARLPFAAAWRLWLAAQLAAAIATCWLSARRC